MKVEGVVGVVGVVGVRGVSEKVPTKKTEEKEQQQQQQQQKCVGGVTLRFVARVFERHLHWAHQFQLTSDPVGVTLPLKEKDQTEQKAQNNKQQSVSQRL